MWWNGNLRLETLTRHQLGREAFLESVWQWKDKYGGIIINQLKRLGASCDWERERFTMDEGLSQAVRQVFVSLYQEGLIYRGKRMINWCPRCMTALANIEVEGEELDGHLYYMRYPLVGGEGGLVVATTRPETMLGDTAVAVHPEDPRYQSLHRSKGDPAARGTAHSGDRVTLMWTVNSGRGPSRSLRPMISMTLKWAESMNWTWCRSSMRTEPWGRQPDRTREWTGMPAAKRIVKDLKKAGFLVKMGDHKHRVGHCYRCQTCGGAHALPAVVCVDQASGRRSHGRRARREDPDHSRQVGKRLFHLAGKS